MKRGIVMTVLASVMTLAGCAKETPITPPDVRYGVDACTKCGMIISDERYAAAMIADEPDGTRHVHLYDDIGCLINHEKDLADQTIRARYVHDVTSKQWIDAEQAYFAQSDKVQTPMATGIVAASFKADAEQLTGATATRWAALRDGSAQADASSVATGDPVKGKQLFAMSCVACHGPDGRGLPNLGLPLHTSEFVLTKSDQQLIDFIKAGRMPGSPDAQTQIPMPPKGGNPALTDEQLQDIVAYLRQLVESEDSEATDVKTSEAASPSPPDVAAQ